MSKKLVILCILTFFLCAAGSSLVNHRIANTAKEVREIPIINSTGFQKNNWVAILESVPQYKKPEAEVPINQLAAEVNISDGKIIGIIASKPNSVIIHDNQSATLEPLQLTVGQGWLQNWEIKEINPDSVIWLNNQNQELYTQMLFNDKNIAQKKLVSEISRIK
jgi:hypothetical protein